MTDPEGQPEACPVEQVERLAHGPADQPVPEDLCRHLEQCAACRARLEAAAAPEIDWVRVRRVLKEQPAKPDAGAAQGGLSFSLLRLLGPSDDPRAVGKIGPFEVTEVIGSGGMGMVLKARDPALDRHVAIKILAPHLASSATARRRFAREARAAAAVIHDHVIAIYQVSEHQELPYLVMPYLPDPSLQQRLDRDGKLDLESALSIGLQVAGGLEAAHAQGLIHRDVKPANVLLAKGTERAIITDFGLARAADDASLTSSGVLAGTPHYMSPEQARGEPVDFRSDLFSLGSLVFAMLTGQPPVNRELGSETIRTIATQPMPPVRTVAADAPEWAERLVGWLHQPKPEDRPESARQVAETLEQCLKHVRSPQTEGLPERLTRAEETEMGHPNDKRLFSLIALGLFLAVFLTPPLVAITTRGEWALAFGGVAACLALFFGCLSWGEKISKLVVVTLGGLVVVAGLVLAATWFYMNQQDSLFQDAKRNAMQREVLSAEAQQKLIDQAVAMEKQRKEAEKEKAGPKGKDPLSGGGYPGMGGPPGGMAGPGAGMPGGDGPPGLELPGFVSPSSMPGMGGPPGMGGVMGGNAGANNTTFAEELKKALGEEVPVPEWKKPKYTPVPQLSGTWVATKAYLNGEEFKSKDKGQGIAMVCFGESIVIRMGRNFNQPELELGSGQTRLVPGGKDKTFMVSGYTMNPNTYTAEPFQRPIFGTLELKGEKLKIAFSENEPALGLGPKKGQDYYEFQAFSQRIPEGLNPILPIQGKKFFCSSVVDWVNFPLLKGIWFCENAQFCREANLNYSKLDPKRFVLTGDGNGLIIYYQAPRQGTTSAEPDVKDRFPKTTWPFWAWSPGGKGPIEVGKLLQFGIGGSEFLNYEIKGNLLRLTVADSIEDLGRNGKYDVFVLKKVEEKWYGEEWQGEKLAKKVEIHAQKSEPMSPPDKSQEKPKDGGQESGKPNEVPAGMVGGGFGGNAVRTFAEELKKALGEELPVPEWKKPKYTPFPQLSGTWIATKAYLNGEEFKSQDKRFKGQDKRQGIAMVCYGESIVIRMGRNFNTPELELGSGQIRLVPGGKDKTFMVRGYSSNPNANGYKQSPIFCTYQIDGEKLSIAFSESEPKLGPLKGQDYYEFKGFSQRFPEELDVTQPISGKKFFCSAVDWVSFPLLKGVWFCESAQFRRETSLNYSKLDPKRFVLTGEGNGLVLYFQATRQRARSAEPDVKDGFPATTWRFHSWSPGGKGPIEAGKLPQFGTAGIEYLNYEYKGDLLHLTVADSIEGLGRDGKNDVFVFKKVTENWLEEEWKGEKLEKKLEIHAQKDKPMSLPDMSQEKPKDGGKESGKPKEIPAGKEPEKAADGKEKGK